MIIVKDSPLEVGWRTWQLQPPEWSLIVVVKATFDIPLEGGRCVLASEQAPLMGDVYEDDDPERPLRYASDFALLKPQGETYLIGTCHAPHGREVTSLLVAFRVGTIAKEIAVIGDRYWIGGLLGGMSTPQPFTSMPLGWDRAFGGRGSKANPMGRGLDPARIDGEERYPLPNIEDRARMLRSSQAAPEPHGAFPVPPSWPRRAAMAGTFGTAWLRKRWPFFPDDVAQSFFFDAPSDQRIVGFWRGNEPIALANLHPEHPRIQAELPGVRARCLIEQRASRDAPASTHEVPLVLDTIVLDADAMKIYATWRGRRPVRSERHEELERIFVSHEMLDAPRSREALERAYQAERERLAREEDEFLPEPMPEVPRG